ncbi:MAG: methyltransferase domain-containing protein [Planctomycetota bacterium]|nr:MAG: methyltransferase domain-containing protein [Planctomycetota bacterium]
MVPTSARLCVSLLACVAFTGGACRSESTPEVAAPAATGVADEFSSPVRATGGPGAGIPGDSQPGALASETDAVALPPPLTHYEGREIAQTMHWKGAEWLLRETRESEEHTARLLAALAVKPGQVVCDLGCGNGFHTLLLAELVGPGGKVFAVDIQQQMLDMLRVRAAEAQLDNIERILGTLADPKLPPDSCDLVLLADVYHEISYPEQVLAGIRSALRPDGRVVLVEFRAEDPDVPIKRLHKMSKAQIRKELEGNGFRLVEEFDELPWQHVMAFGRAE